jgi:hypothetical protein
VRCHEKPTEEFWGRGQLFDEYNCLLSKYNRLKEENRQLKEQLERRDVENSSNFLLESEPDKCNLATIEGTRKPPNSIVVNTSDSSEKIKLYPALFKGRDDVYAKRWENKKNGTAGYAPVCLNEWMAGICGKPKKPCSGCAHKSYAVLNESVIEDHLRGTIVAGVYPILPYETCNFLAIDFDESDWQKDITMLRAVCAEFAIPVAVERSRSGNGGHAWFFFDNPISAALARKFGAAMLTYSMDRRHEIKFKSYDRLFPS